MGRRRWPWGSAELCITLAGLSCHPAGCCPEDSYSGNESPMDISEPLFPDGSDSAQKNPESQRVCVGVFIDRPDRVAHYGCLPHCTDTPLPPSPPPPGPCLPLQVRRDAVALLGARIG